MRVDFDGSAVFNIGAGAVVAFVDVLVGAAAAPGPHSAFWNSFQGESEGEAMMRCGAFMASHAHVARRTMELF
jgi:hypothetical protein